MSIVAVPGDASQTNIGITKVTFDRLLKEDKFVELIALYAFYCYTARWQKTDRAKCTDAYAATGIKRSREHVQRMRKRLEEMGLVRLETTRGEGGKIEGFYVRVFYLTNAIVIDAHTGQQNQCDPNPVVATNHTNALELRKGNASKLVEAQSALPLAGAEGKKRFTPPSKQEVSEHFKSLGMNGSADREAEKFIAYYQSVGWSAGRKKLTCWRGAATGWKLRNDDRNAPPVTGKDESAYWQDYPTWIASKGPKYAEFKDHRYAPDFIKTEYHRERKGAKKAA